MLRHAIHIYIFIFYSTEQFNVIMIYDTDASCIGCVMLISKGMELSKSVLS